jgi:hypothetical protein
VVQKINQKQNLCASATKKNNIQTSSFKTIERAGRQRHTLQATMASEASSEDDGGSPVSSSSSSSEEQPEVSLNQRIQAAGATLSLSGEDLQWVPALLMQLAPLSLSSTLTVGLYSC